MTLSCVIVDDEPLALSMLETYVLRTPFLALAGKFSSATVALGWLKENAVDLIFLDIRMPDLSGLDIARVTEQYSSKGNMKVIFTTAYSQYALEGYKVQPIDYLLKPYNYNDFTAAVSKAVHYFSLIRNENNAADIFGDRQYVYLKVGYEVVRLDTAEIAYLESAKDYVLVFLTSHRQPLKTYSTLKKLFEKLPEEKFIKIHRSFIIAKEKVASVTKSTVTIEDTTIPVSEKYRDGFLEFIENWQ
jgi:two-component system response regulator LytT